MSLWTKHEIGRNAEHSNGSPAEFVEELWHISRQEAELVLPLRAQLLQLPVRQQGPEGPL